MLPTLIVDPGSCHMGKLSYAMELTEVAANAGAHAIKWQLFNDLPPNIPLPREWFPQLVEYGRKLGLEVFASVWDEAGIDLLIECKCSNVKFAYSQREKLYSYPVNKLQEFGTVYISGDILTNFPDGLYPLDVQRLYCDAQYAHRYEIDFSNMFPPFDGVSLHELGMRQTVKAIQAGAGTIERHITLDKDDITVPDHKFALKPDDLAATVKIIEGIEQGLSI